MAYRIEGRTALAKGAVGIVVDRARDVPSKISDLKADGFLFVAVLDMHGHDVSDVFVPIRRSVPTS